MSITTVIKFKVADREKFETSFATRAGAREAAGLEFKAHRDMDDPTGVVVLGTVESKDAFFGFMSSAEQQDAMKNATIQGSPEVTFLEG